MAQWEEFTGRASRSGSSPAVTIQKTGVLSLNAEAFDALGKPEAVVLLFDRDGQAMGLRASPKTVLHAYRLRAQGGGQSHLVSGRAFLARYGLAVDAAKRYPAAMDGDILSVNLTEGGSVARKPRPRREARERKDAPTTPTMIAG
jgi:hypothetical protein